MGGFISCLFTSSVLHSVEQKVEELAMDQVLSNMTVKPEEKRIQWDNKLLSIRQEAIYNELGVVVEIRNLP